MATEGGKAMKFRVVLRRLETFVSQAQVDVEAEDAYSAGEIAKEQGEDLPWGQGEMEASGDTLIQRVEEVPLVQQLEESLRDRPGCVLTGPELTAKIEEMESALTPDEFEANMEFLRSVHEEVSQERERQYKVLLSYTSRPRGAYESQEPSFN